MTTFILLRHAKPDYSVYKGMQFTGIDGELAFLSKEGIEQARQIAKNPVFIGAEALISSPYTRAMHTASFISLQTGLPIIGEFGLREWNPDINGKSVTREIIIQRYKKAASEFDRFDISDNKAYEPLYQTRDRAIEVLANYLDYSKVIVVTHAGVLYSLLGKRFEKAEYMVWNYEIERFID